MSDLTDILLQLRDMERRLQTVELRRQLAAKTVVAGDIDWASLPPVTIWHLTNYDGGSAFGGWQPPTTGTYQSLGASWGFVDGDALPARPGFARQYRYFLEYFYAPSAGTTAASCSARITAAGFAVADDPGAPYNVQKDRRIVGAWFTSDATFEATMSTNDLLFGEFLGNQAGAAVAYYVRVLGIQGRYVAA